MFREIKVEFLDKNLTFRIVCERRSSSRAAKATPSIRGVICILQEEKVPLRVGSVSGLFWKGSLMRNDQVVLYFCDIVIAELVFF